MTVIKLNVCVCRFYAPCKKKNRKANKTKAPLNKLKLEFKKTFQQEQIELQAVRVNLRPRFFLFNLVLLQNRRESFKKFCTLPVAHPFSLNVFFINALRIEFSFNQKIKYTQS